jgi:nucleoside-diphosphate-sugar epimerase
MIGATVLVTGAGGFIGGAVARALAEQPDLVVHGATRDGRAIADGITACRLDVRDEAGLAATLKGVDAVVHCAVGGRDTTVDGTRLLLRAALAAGVRRIVHFSSIAVYGAQGGAVDETATLVPPVGRGYAHWKAAAEAICREAAADGADVIILRPAIVYGPGSYSWIVQPAQRLLSGNWGALGEVGRGTCNPVHVDDVASACVAAIHAPANPGRAEAFNIAGHETISWSGWYARLNEALGRPTLPEVSPAMWRHRMVTALPWKAAARVLPFARRVAERRLLSAPSRSELALFGLVATYPTQKAASVLGWQDRIGLDEGLNNATAWLQSVGISC